MICTTAATVGNIMDTVTMGSVAMMDIKELQEKGLQQLTIIQNCYLQNEKRMNSHLWHKNISSADWDNNNVMV